MFALVLFTDGIYYVCERKHIVRHKNYSSARYKGKRYTCHVIAQYGM